MLSPVVFQDELRSELRSSSPSGLGCIENMTSEIASLADKVSTGTVKWGFPSAVNSTTPAIPIGCSRDCDGAEDVWGAVMIVPAGPRDFSKSSNLSRT